MKHLWLKLIKELSKYLYHQYYKTKNENDLIYMSKVQNSI